MLPEEQSAAVIRESSRKKTQQKEKVDMTDFFPSVMKRSVWRPDLYSPVKKGRFKFLN